jgi:hypothetical protein
MTCFHLRAYTHIHTLLSLFRTENPHYIKCARATRDEGGGVGWSGVESVERGEGNNNLSCFSLTLPLLILLSLLQEDQNSPLTLAEPLSQGTRHVFVE